MWHVLQSVWRGGERQSFSEELDRVAAETGGRGSGERQTGQIILIHVSVAVCTWAECLPVTAGAGEHGEGQRFSLLAFCQSNGQLKRYDLMMVKCLCKRNWSLKYLNESDFILILTERRGGWKMSSIQALFIYHERRDLLKSCEYLERCPWLNWCISS